jgi:hypothetical protein
MEHHQQHIIPNLELELPDNFEKYEASIQHSIIQYLQQLNDIERKAYKIAKMHLGSSFNIVKSNGYNDWKKSK